MTAITSRFTHLACAVGFALGLATAAGSAVAAPLQPTGKQLSALCNTCVFVTEVKAEKRKGEASGLGAAGGAIAGGVVGNKVGDSTGATLGGAVLGGVIGHQIERKVKTHQVWVVEGLKRDRSAARQEFQADPQLKAGDVVQVTAEGWKKR